MNFKNNWINARVHSGTNTNVPCFNSPQKHWDCGGAFSDSNHKRYVYKKIFATSRMIITDQARRSRFEQAELDGIIIKSILSAQRLHRESHGPRLSYYDLKPRLLRRYRKPRGTISRIRNRCVITARSSIVGSTGLSRICFRQRAGTGKIPGYFKI